MESRYLFLDVDGVLNSERTVAAYGKLTHAGRVKQDMLTGTPIEPMWDLVAIKLLRAAQELIGFKIVISSTWRKSFSLQDFHTIFDHYGWDTRDIIVGKTGDNVGKRGDQIKAWLDTHGRFPYNYCIIDDDSDMLDSQAGNFVKTSFREGLNYDTFESIFDVFGETYTQVGTLGFNIVAK